MPAYVISLIRTAVPYIVGAVLNLPLTPVVLHFLGVSNDRASAYLGAGVTFLLGSAYYAIVRVLEQRKPGFGWLLGIARRIGYTGDPVSDAKMIMQVHPAVVLDVEKFADQLAAKLHLPVPFPAAIPAPTTPVVNVITPTVTAPSPAPAHAAPEVAAAPAVPAATPAPVAEPTPVTPPPAAPAS